jgi:hypothetical protein
MGSRRLGVTLPNITPEKTRVWCRIVEQRHNAFGGVWDANAMLQTQHTLLVQICQTLLQCLERSIIPGIGFDGSLC